jgi:hypothetical protein
MMVYLRTRPEWLPITRTEPRQPVQPPGEQPVASPPATPRA